MQNQPDKSTRIWGMSCHLAALALFAVPFGSILGPLIVWLIQKDKHPFIDEQGLEAVNFQISMVIYTILLTLLLTLILSIDRRTGNVYVLAGQEIEIVIYPNGYWIFV